MTKPQPADEDRLFNAANTLDDLRHLMEMETDIYVLHSGAPVELRYESTRGGIQSFEGEIVTVSKRHLAVDNGDDNQRIARWDGVKTTTKNGERTVGEIQSIKLARPQAVKDDLEKAVNC